jgi:hypothetical protein
MQCQIVKSNSMQCTNQVAVIVKRNGVEEHLCLLDFNFWLGSHLQEEIEGATFERIDPTIDIDKIVATHKR